MPLNRTVTELQDSLKRVRELAVYIRADSMAALADPTMRRRHETMQCASVVLLSGYFESFLRDVARTFVDEVSRIGPPFAVLRDPIKRAHYEEGGKILAKFSQAIYSTKPMRLPSNATREDVLARLHSVASTTSTSRYFILWEAFVDTGSNPGPDVVSDICKRLGVPDSWQKIGAAGGGPGPGTMRAVLNDMVGIRNVCAHTGTVTPIPTPSQLEGFADNLEAIATAMVALLNAELVFYQAAVPPPPPPPPPP
jgi:hypothetical protein